MTKKKILIPELGKYSDIKYAYDQVIKNNSNILLNPNCLITYKGLQEYLLYDQNSLKFILDLSLKESEQIFNDPKRQSNRSLSTIINNTIVGNLGELSFSLDYRMNYKDFKNQMLEKHNNNGATAYDLLHMNKKAEIKTIHFEYLYNSDRCVPIDTSNNGIHPKYWRKEYGMFDVLIAFNVWQGRFRPLGELVWNVYENSFFYGTGKGSNGDFFNDKIMKDPKLGRKIIVPYGWLDPVYTNFPLLTS